MLIRFVVKNLFSFKEETEFNLFPNKTTRLSHHKIDVNGIDILRMSALYGANGSGKSNLIKSISLMQNMVVAGNIEKGIESKKFKLSTDCKHIPFDLGIEFFCNNKIYYYTFSVNDNQVVYEYFAESKKDKDIMIFEREIKDNVQSIAFFPEYYTKNEGNKLFISILQDKILEKNQLLLSFLSTKYENEFIDIKNAYYWFASTLNIITPTTALAGLAHFLDVSDNTVDFANKLVSTFNTGISKLKIITEDENELKELYDKKEYDKMLSESVKLDSDLYSIQDKKTNDEIILYKDGEKLIAKRIFTEHNDEQGNPIKFSLSEESDGTRRLLDYVLPFDILISTNAVFLIDEIERSIHPLIIKEIISKFSLDELAKGQLIFTTHESCLLDQDILRTDEIWFSQKDNAGATKLYSLSDFKVHNTIDIENGYLNGRYGGIPFLSNLHDLNWHK